MLCPLCGRNACRNHGIHQASSIEVTNQIVAVCPTTDFFDLVIGMNPSASHVVRIFQADETRPDKMRIGWANFID